MKNWILAVGILILVIAAVALPATLRSGPTVKNDGKLNVVTTFYPLAFAAQEVGGDKVKVTNLTSGGLEPHEFEPTSRDIVLMQNADLLITLGEIDTWANDVVAERRAAGKAVLVVGEAVPMETHSGVLDPHIWLDPVRMKDIVSSIKESIWDTTDMTKGERLSPTFDLLAALDSLDVDYQNLESCSKNDIIVAHDAFQYVAERYGFTAHAVSGISPDQEPSAKDLAELSDLAKELSVRTVFFEETVSPALAETVAREAGAQTDVLYTLESLTRDELDRGENYLTLMQDNYQKLEGALCP